MHKEKIRNSEQVKRICYNCHEMTTNAISTCPKERVSRCAYCKEGYFWRECPKRRSGKGRQDARGRGRWASTISNFVTQGVTTDGVVVKVLLDTGSENILTREGAVRMGLKISKGYRLLRGFGRGTVYTESNVQFTIYVGATMLVGNAIVVSTIINEVDLILGQPTLGKQGLKIQMNKDQVELVREIDIIQSKMIGVEEKPRNKVRMVRDVRLEPDYSTLVEVTADQATVQGVQLPAKIWSEERREIAIGSGAATPGKVTFCMYVYQKARLLGKLRR